MRHLRNTVGLNIVRAYGNASTDIAAYADAGIAKADTYIIELNAGAAGTQPIHGEYGAHHAFVVTPTPQASCRR